MTLNINKKTKKLVILVAGGTGGHIFPAISIFHSLKNKFNFSVITDERGEKYFKNLKNKNNFDESLFINVFKSSSPFERGILHKIKFTFLAFFLIFKSIKLFLKLKPQLLIGFGGYSTVIPCLIAKLLGIRYLLHEQNAVMGRANKFLEKFSTFTFTSFKNTLPKSDFKKRIFSGTPVREEFYDLNVKKDNEEKKKYFNILIFGGSLGADFFSSEIPDIICSLDKNVKNKLKVTHQVLQSKLKIVKESYSKNKIKSNVKTFFPNIIKHYKYADLIIARSGGSTLAEVLISKIPSIIIPLKNSMDNHQVKNSNLISENFLGWVFHEDNIVKDDIINLLNRLILNKRLNSQIIRNIKFFSEQTSRFQCNKLPYEIIYEKITRILNNKIQYRKGST